MTPSDYVRLAGGVLIIGILAAAALAVYALRRGVRGMDTDTRPIARPLPPVSAWDQQARPAPHPAPSGRVRIDPPADLPPGEPVGIQPYRCGSTLDHPAHAVADRGSIRFCTGRRSGPRRFRV